MTKLKFMTGLLLAILLGFASVACGSSNNNSSRTASTAATPAGSSATGGGTSAIASTAATPPAAQRVTGSMTVFAAASLTDSFNEIATAFKAANPGVDVTFNFAGSSALRAQLDQGAPADVFASADTNQMTSAAQNGDTVDTGKLFVHNTPVVITPKDNPAGITSLADLKKPGIKLVLAAPEVPIGNYARQVLANASKDAAYGTSFADDVLRNLASNEANVKGVVAKVQLGEADAGIVYGTDVTPSVAGALNRIDIPAAVNVVADYPIAVTKEAKNPKAAQAFIDFVLSNAGQTILEKWGFQTVRAGTR